MKCGGGNDSIDSKNYLLHKDIVAKWNHVNQMRGSACTCGVLLHQNTISIATKKQPQKL